MAINGNAKVIDSLIRLFRTCLLVIFGLALKRASIDNSAHTTTIRVIQPLTVSKNMGDMIKLKINKCLIEILFNK